MLMLYSYLHHLQNKDVTVSKALKNNLRASKGERRGERERLSCVWELPTGRRLSIMETLKPNIIATIFH